MMASAPFSPAFCVISSTVPWTTSLGGSYGIFPFRPSSGKSLRFDGVSFEPEEYSGLKGFFNIVQAGDNGQAVLQPQQTANVQP